MGIAPMTVAIASFQRRGPLMRLLRGLEMELAADERLRRDLDIVVVLDGSTDGSREAVEVHEWSVPVRVHWQPNAGLASARNAGLKFAAGRVVWFLDDDLVPSPGLVARHRRAHDTGSAAVLMGPCRIPEEADAPAGLRRWWDDFYANLEADGVVTSFDRFTTANTSAPAELLDAVGGFDPGFVEYGLEDYELGIRLLRNGTRVNFDAAAIAWHPDVPSAAVLIARERGIGLNATRIVRMHPDTVDVLFPPGPVWRPRVLLRKSRLRRPWELMAVSRVALCTYRVTSSLPRFLSPKGEMLARAAAHAAGVAEGDASGELLDRVLGYARRSRSR